jgi:hypothetical protein
LGLDAFVFCDCIEKGRLSIPHPWPRLLFIGPNGSPEIRSGSAARVAAHDDWMELPPCRHDQMMLDSCHLGSATHISLLRESLVGKDKNYPVLLDQVFYSGTHCGDHLEVEDVRTLSAELARLRETKLLTVAGRGKDTTEFISTIKNLRRLAKAALSINKPLAF